MLQKVQSFIIKHELLNYNKPVLVGVSGGADSVALWHILKTLGYKCIIAHCNFHLRHEESDRDEVFVKTLAESYNTTFYKIDFDTYNYASEHGISLEMAARELRYNWFYKLLKEHDAQAIAIAHHADDNIETMLLNLIRGTGLRGLTGMPIRNKNVVRPLLCCSRQEIEQYLSDNQLSHVEDSTNRETDCKRNIIRNKVLPLLEELNPSVRQTLYKSSERFKETYHIYSDAIQSVTQDIITPDTEILKIDIKKLKSYPYYPSILYELISPYGFNSMIVEQISDSLNKDSGKQFFSETHGLLKDRETLILYKKHYHNNEKIYLIHEHTSYPDYPVKLKFEKIINSVGFEVSRKKYRIHIDIDKIQYPLQLRKWHEGDSFQPFGMKGMKKLSDFFIDNKLNLLQKEAIWLLVSGDEKIIWIVGIRADNRFRINENTQNILEITLIK